MSQRGVKIRSKLLLMLFASVILALLTMVSVFSQDCTSAELAITTAELPQGTINTAYSAAIAGSGGNPSYIWSFTGTLPTGLTASQSNCVKSSTSYHPYYYIKGTPTVSGIFPIKIFLNDGTNTASQDFTITITGASTSNVVISTSSLAAATVNAGYSQLIAATGGTLPYAWTIVSGNLPAGLSFTTESSSGKIAGTPTASGTFTFTVKVEDFSSPKKSATKQFTLNVNTAPGCVPSGSNAPGTCCGSRCTDGYCRSSCPGGGSGGPGPAVPCYGDLQISGNYELTVQPDTDCKYRADASFSQVPIGYDSIGAPILSSEQTSVSNNVGLETSLSAHSADPYCYVTFKSNDKSKFVPVILTATHGTTQITQQTFSFTFNIPTNIGQPTGCTQPCSQQLGTCDPFSISNCNKFCDNVQYFCAKYPKDSGTPTWYTVGQPACNDATNCQTLTYCGEEMKCYSGKNWQYTKSFTLPPEDCNTQIDDNCINGPNEGCGTQTCPNILGPCTAATSCEESGGQSISIGQLKCPGWWCRYPRGWIQEIPCNPFSTTISDCVVECGGGIKSYCIGYNGVNTWLTSQPQCTTNCMTSTYCGQTVKCFVAETDPNKKWKYTDGRDVLPTEVCGNGIDEDCVGGDATCPSQCTPGAACTGCSGGDCSTNNCKYDSNCQCVNECWGSLQNNVFLRQTCSYSTCPSTGQIYCDSGDCPSCVNECTTAGQSCTDNVDGTGTKQECKDSDNDGCLELYNYGCPNGCSGNDCA